MVSELEYMATQKRARNKTDVTLQHGDVTRIAREINRSPSHVWRVLARKRDSKSVAAEVERIVGVPFSRIHLAV